jgi:hypothetical protein
MTTESQLKVTVNRQKKDTWERFYPEDPIVEEYNVPEFLALKKFWNTYITASNSGFVDALDEFLSAYSILY